MKILVVDNTLLAKFHGSYDLCQFNHYLPNSQFDVRRGPEDDLPKDKDLLNYKAVIISGSKTSALDRSQWVQNLASAIRKWTDHNIPILGVCYGHQVVSYALDGEQCIRKSATPEAGWSEIEIQKKSKLFEGLKKKFWALSFHDDEVCDLSNQFVVTASSEKCSIQAFDLKNKPVFGVQFHPEKSLEDALSAENSFKGAKHKFAEHGRSKSLYKSELGETIFKNFFKLC